jgi:threonylcarbamoyladenosine tRNA methylthiotransferase MtaB
MDFSEGLLSILSQSNKICPHLHIPIQSGDDEILKRMNRIYQRTLLSDLIVGLHKKIPLLSIGADVMVGFPGETEERFESTYRLIESLPLSYLHVFPFSRRTGTPASQFSHQVDAGKIKKRAERMRELGRRKRETFYRQFLQQELTVLVEGQRGKEEGGVKGLSRNYIPVLLIDENRSASHLDRINREWRVKVTEITETGMRGGVVEH